MNHFISGSWSDMHCFFYNKEIVRTFALAFQHLEQASWTQMEPSTGMGLSAMLNPIFSQQVEFFQMQQDTEDPMYHFNKILYISLESDIDDWDRESVTVFNIQLAKAALITIENAFLVISSTKISTNKHCFLERFLVDVIQAPFARRNQVLYLGVPFVNSSHYYLCCWVPHLEGWCSILALEISEANFPLFYIEVQNIWAIFIIALYFSRYSKLKLGTMDDEPEFNTVTWFMMCVHLQYTLCTSQATLCTTTPLLKRPST